MQEQFENIKKYVRFMDNRITTEIIENPEQYDTDIDFWIDQYDKIENRLKEMVEKLCIKIHVGHRIFGANMAHVYIRGIEQSRNGMIKFEEFLELIRQNEWGKITQEWYGFHINCFNSKLAEKCSEIARKSNKHDVIERRINNIDILDFEVLDSYLKGYVGDQIEKTKHDPIHIPEKARDKFNEYSNDFFITYHGYYIIHNLAKGRENERKSKEINNMIDFLF